MRITMTEKYYCGYWQGWKIKIDGISYPTKKGYVYTRKSAIDALTDCFFVDRQGIEPLQIIKESN